MKQNINNPPRIKGFEKSNSVTNPEIEKFLRANFPLKFLNKLRKIIYVNSYVPTTRNEPLDVLLSKGLFKTYSHFISEDQGSERIEIYRQDPIGENKSQSIFDIVTYAISESIYENLPQNIKDEWEKLVINCVRDKSLTPSRFAEEFSQSYYFFLNQPTKLQKRGMYSFFETYFRVPKSQLVEPQD